MPAVHSQASPAPPADAPPAAPGPTTRSQERRIASAWKQHRCRNPVLPILLSPVSPSNPPRPTPPGPNLARQATPRIRKQSMPGDAPLMLSVSGCRGIFGKTMTPVVAARFAGVFGSYLRERTGAGARPLVVLGRDGRAGGRVLLDAAAAGLVAAGCDALLLDVAMTPTIGVMVDARDAAGGLIITASHNPQEWNG